MHYSEPAIDGHALARRSSHPSIALAWGTGVESLVAQDGSAALFVHSKRRSDICLFGAVGDAPDARRRFTREYLEAAAARRRRSVFVQVRSDQVAELRDLGAQAEVLGRSYSIHLPDFTLKGKPLAKVRQNVNRATRDGVTVSEVTGLADDSRAAIDRVWLAAKGRHTKMLRFMVGDPASESDRGARTFVARVDGDPVAYIVYSPTFADSAGWLYDLPRRRPDAPVGVIEAINLHALGVFREEGARWLHLGLTPFVGVPAPTVGSDSRRLTTVLWALSRYGGGLYPAVEQERFKLKWNPHVIEPEFVCYTPAFSLTSTYALMSVANML